MQKRLLFILAFCFLLLTACGGSKNRPTVVTKKHKNTTRTTKRKTKKPVHSSSTNSAVANAIVKTAKSYRGTRYKYGGTTKAGMDCSGLIYTAYKKENITLPRVSSAMATSGNWVDVKKVKVGDLLFFATKKNSRKINHVGLVTSSRSGHVEFIHASSSKGVIISNLAEKYWYFAFVQARRLL